ncbi:hypothetical protein LSCM1_07905 [Leishmania martiniquensis]|uniref:Uncharacterized protein n=1 Tax=Leishmania martiniquensis TaxID=1580590 RepID=A0A836H2C0_9TRYP|nr:hypothetical protein LSCM1_07905 [Leishmania martiniquensis]
MDALPVRREDSEGPTLAAAPSSVLYTDPVTRSAEGDAIEIADMDMKDSFSTGLDGRDMFVESGCVLSEEAMPPCMSAPYMEALFNTDPRISFDALHIGAFHAIEEREGMRRSLYDSASWCLPPTELVEQPAGDGAPFFTVPLMHPTVRARPPLERGDREVDGLLSHPTREALTAAMGADMIEHLRFSRSTDAMRRRRSKRRR